MESGLKFIHLNFNNAMVVSNQLSHDTSVKGVDVVSLKEPYVSEGSVLGTRNGWCKWPR